MTILCLRRLTWMWQRLRGVCRVRWQGSAVGMRLLRSQMTGRVKPVSRAFGFDRGQPIDRYYMEGFLNANRRHIRGQVLEIGDNAYTLKFSDGEVTRSDVLNARATGIPGEIIGDLATRDGLPEALYDCIILTQVLSFIYDWQTAIRSCFGLLKEDGCVLVTLPGISQISRYDMDRWGDYWRFTDASVQRAFSAVFGKENVRIEVHGNVLSACALLYGLASHELSSDELGHCDPDYQVVIAVVATKTVCG